jgi:hypothetical protein
MDEMYFGCASTGRENDRYPIYKLPGVWKRIYAEASSSLPLCSITLRLARDPLVDPLWVTRETGGMDSDLRGGFVGCGVRFDFFVFVGSMVGVFVTVDVTVREAVGVVVTVEVGVALGVEVVVAVNVGVNVTVGG